MRAATLGFLLVLLTGMSASDTPRTVVRGNVRDPVGAAIGGAYVIVHLDRGDSDQSTPPLADIVLHTDERGDFSANVPPAFYDIFVTGTAFSPACKKVRVKVGKPATATFSLSLDPLVSKETGHEIGTVPK